MRPLPARWIQLVCAVSCLAGAAVLAPSAPVGHGDVLGAVGASMGGMRVMVIDGFFLRAEGLRRSGRADDAAALYRTVLQLDPANEAASIFLANVYHDALLPQVRDLEQRLRWWKEARALLERALEHHPDSPRIHARIAALIMDVGFADARLEARLNPELGRPRLVALRHLRKAVRGAETLPKMGRNHLRRIAAFAPLVAGDALRDGDRDAFREAVEAGREALTLRGEVLVRMPLSDIAEGNLAQFLELGLALVQSVARVAWGTGNPRIARELLAAYREAVPESPLVAALEDVLAR